MELQAAVLTYVYYFNFYGFIHADILKWGIFDFTGIVQYELDLASWVLFCFVCDMCYCCFLVVVGY